MAAAPASANPSRKKAIWGPTHALGGGSAFPIYADLGVGIFEQQLNWSSVARTRPANPTDPTDPAYRWPTDTDFAISEAQRYGISVCLQIGKTPGWANGGKTNNWVPNSSKDFADFATAASRRYPSVHLWMIWGEPTRRANFMPLPRRPRGGRRLRRAPSGVRIYARLLAAAYRSLKGVTRSNIVIGGNSFTTGDVTPRDFLRFLRLPNGKPPPMDLYGHNPFSRRRPSLRSKPLGFGFADFSDLDTLGKWLDRTYRGHRRHRLKLFLSEYFLPTDHANREFNFWVSHQTQASFLHSALNITRHWWRIYTLGWYGLYDDPPQPDGREVNRGLINRSGQHKLAYDVFKRY